jgi:DNA-binding response OmpR family regulator
MIPYIVVTREVSAMSKDFLPSLAKHGWLVSCPSDLSQLQRQIERFGAPALVIYNGVEISDEEKSLITNLKIHGRTQLITVISEGDEMFSEETFFQQADDFILWPVSEPELTLRVRRLLQSSQTSYASTTYLNSMNRSQSLTPSRVTSRMIATDEEWRYRLSLVERQIVRRLQEAQGEVVPLDTLLTCVSGKTVSMRVNALRVYINRLRNKIQSMSLPQSPRIVTVRGVGYRLEES